MRTPVGLRHTTLQEWLGESLRAVGNAFERWHRELTRGDLEELTKLALVRETVVLAAMFQEAAMTIQLAHGTTPPWDTEPDEMRTWASMAFRVSLNDFKAKPASIPANIVAKVGDILVLGEEPLAHNLEALGGNIELARRPVRHCRREHRRLGRRTVRRRRTLRVIDRRDDEADKPPVLVVEEAS